MFVQRSCCVARAWWAVGIPDRAQDELLCLARKEQFPLKTIHGADHTQPSPK